MYYVGIDISINSPGITIFNTSDEKYKFICYGVQKQLDEIKYKPGQRMLQDIGDVSVNPMFRKYKTLSKKEKNQYSLVETVKMRDAITNSSKIVNNIDENIDTDENVFIGIEGYSYGSRSNSLIDIVTLSSLIRSKLFNIYNDEQIYVFTPSKVKMFAGKELDEKTGNASKFDMFNYFLDNVLGDSYLEASDFYNHLNNNTSEFLLGRNNKKVREPVSDIVDSYFVLKKLQNVINE